MTFGCVDFIPLNRVPLTSHGRHRRGGVKRDAAIVGADGLLVDSADLEAYGHDEYALETYLQIPRAVVRPSSEQKVAGIVRLCAETGVPITARGGGTGLSLERLNRVVEADADNYALTVQAGVTLAQINRAAEEIGLFFPPHPGDEGAMAGGAGPGLPAAHARRAG